MRVRLLGTGSADRWPNPWCRCPSCDWARSTGALRDRTSALIDGSLLVDPGPDAGGRGVDLSGVRTVLITHDHPDHLDPAFLLAWEWAAVAKPIARDSSGPDTAGRGSRSGRRTLPPMDRPRRSGRAAAARRRGHPPGGPHLVRPLPAAHSTTGGRATTGPPCCTTSPERWPAALRHRHRWPAARRPGRPVRPGAARGDLRGSPGPWHRPSGPPFLHPRGPRPARCGTPDARVPGRRSAPQPPQRPVACDPLAGIGAEVLPDGAMISVGVDEPVGRDPAASGVLVRCRDVAVWGGIHRGRRRAPAGPAARLLVTGGARSGKSHYAESVVARRRATPSHLCRHRPQLPRRPGVADPRRGAPCSTAHLMARPSGERRRRRRGARLRARGVPARGLPDPLAHGSAGPDRVGCSGPGHCRRARGSGRGRRGAARDDRRRGPRDQRGGVRSRARPAFGQALP